MVPEMLRTIIKIDEEKCDGCGVCVPSCKEGAIKIIDNKARLISDMFCDGLGACIGECPQGAITLEEREAEPYDEARVMEYILSCGLNTVKAHLEHLIDHDEFENLQIALDFLKERGIKVDINNEAPKQAHSSCGCPGSQAQEIKPVQAQKTVTPSGEIKSELRQWPIQLHLVAPQAPYYRNADLLLAADCAGFVAPAFHSEFLKNKSIAIACPKLDQNQTVYVEKLIEMIDYSKINTLTVLIMKVPCCGGLVRLAQTAVSKAVRKVPLKAVVLDFDGSIIEEEWI